MVIVFVMMILFAPPVQAYIDPGTGSYLLTLVVSFIATGMHFFYKIFRESSSHPQQSLLQVPFHRRKKAEVLESLQNFRHPGVKILPQIRWSRKDWRKNANRIIQELMSQFSEQSLIIRSSASSEDADQETKAGQFLSLELLFPFEESQLRQTIEQVFSSLPPGDDEWVFAQPYIDAPDECGVIFSQAPGYSRYCRVSRVLKPERSDWVTASLAEHEATYYLQRECSQNHLPGMDVLLQMTLAIESFFSIRPLDIEYVKVGDEIIVLQVRRLQRDDQALARSSVSQQKHLASLRKRVSSELQEYSCLSRMSDWNPAEILGPHPHPLDRSLYRFLFTDRVWRESRKQLGYHCPEESCLSLSLGNDEYIRVSLSLSSLIPQSIPQANRQRAIDALLEKLSLGEVSHDEVEFFLTCSQFSLIDSKQECAELLRQHALELIQSNLTCWGLENPVEWLRTQDFTHVEDLKKLSYLFCQAARLAFVSRRWLRELESLHVDAEALQAWVGQCSKLAVNDLVSWIGDGATGQQNCRAKSFAIVENSFVRPVQRHQGVTTESVIRFAETLLSSLSEFPFNKKEFANFITRSLTARESFKRCLTHHVSLFLRKAREKWKTHGFRPEDLAFLSLAELSAIQPTNELRRSVLVRRAHYELQRGWLLPEVITRPEQLLGFHFSQQGGHYVGDFNVEGRVHRFNSASKPEQIRDSILLLERGEPGLDWIFTAQPKAVVTRFGGPNSHVAIRCLETRTQGVLGVGECIYQNLLTAAGASIQGQNKHLEIYKVYEKQD